MSLTNWVVTRSPNLARRRPGDLIARHQAWFDERMAQLRAWGLDAAPLQTADSEEGSNEAVPIGDVAAEP
jgi:hypothetical protein